ncbi:MAG TPA: guanylate cyclase [Bacteroidales bacterium]|nr:guanylate cyclase [Bacteroidales bacterium]
MEDFLQERENLILKINELEKENADLLCKIQEYEALIKKLPSEKDNDANRPLRFKMVTVLFSNVKGFSQLTTKDNAEDLIDELDKFYFQFDSVVQRYNIEKVNAIGDTYISAGGIPRKNRTNPIEVVLAALEMQQYMKKLQEDAKLKLSKIWDLTFGIHTGPVNATTSGKKKITFDIKGETVNIASRIEASGEIGKIYISGMTHEIVQEYFRCEYIAKIPVKYQGDIAIYSVKGLRPEYSEDDFGLVPNRKFKTKFQLIKYDDLEEYMLDRLEKELPQHLFYHNLKHTIDVVIQVELIGRGEEISEEDLLLLKTAALFHDAGHTIKSQEHEYLGTQIVNEILPKYGYDQNQIEIINGIIMATKLPPTPHTLLQKIICDADLDYLGRTDFIPVSETLFKELSAQNILTNYNEWNKLQVKFLSGHSYFTDTANKLREVNKQGQIDRIKKLIIE